MNLALFDFDGTITNGDSYFHFIKFCFSKSSLLLNGLVCTPWLIGYKLGLVPNYRAKERITTQFFKGMTKDRFDSLAEEFVEQRLNSILKAEAMKTIFWHYHNGDRIIVVSASFEDYLKFWCQQHELEVIATRLEWEDNKITGSFDTPNCYGPEKVNRLKRVVNFSDYDQIYAYGDSRGDKEMLEIANKKFYKHF
ncbi:MAG: HAD family hydrolase [Candidatus Rifleibacteriota bacterium]